MISLLSQQGNWKDVSNNPDEVRYLRPGQRRVFALTGIKKTEPRTDKDRAMGYGLTPAMDALVAFELTQGGPGYTIIHMHERQTSREQPTLHFSLSAIMPCGTFYEPRHGEMRANAQMPANLSLAFNKALDTLEAFTGTEIKSMHDEETIRNYHTFGINTMGSAATILNQQQAIAQRGVEIDGTQFSIGEAPMGVVLSRCHEVAVQRRHREFELRR